MVSSNAAFNLVRETLDHGVVNSWLAWRRGASATRTAAAAPHLKVAPAYFFARRDRNTYQAHSWDPTNLETLPIYFTRNLLLSNYRSIFAIDNDDGSNGCEWIRRRVRRPPAASHDLNVPVTRAPPTNRPASISPIILSSPDVVTRNWLLWSGAKNLMGYNKAFLENAYVYADYTPFVSPQVRALGFSQGEGGAALRAKYGGGDAVPFCTGSVAPWASADLGLADQFRGNTCICSSSAQFFRWYDVSCEARRAPRVLAGAPH